jgi:tripartite-type tricarboxylate transporter receptor subunit TctC
MKKNLLFFILLFVFNYAQAGWPTRDVTIIVPFPPGGVNDQLARSVAPNLEKQLGISVNIINIPGAANGVALNHVLASPNNNHTFVLTNEDIILGQTLAGTNLHKQFQPVAIISTVPMLLVTNNSAGVAKFQKDLKKHAKVNIGNNGIGGAAAVWLSQSKSSLDINQIPYKGATPLLVDTLSGQVDYGLMSITGWHQNLQAKKIFPIFVTSQSRSPVLPNVPTFTELGIRGESANIWFGVFTRQDTDGEAVYKFNRALRNVLTLDLTTKFQQSGMNFLDFTPRQAETFINSEIKKTNISN